MKIDFERSGGLTGLHTTATIDTNSLAAADCQQLQELIETAAFFELPSHLTKSPSAVPDQFYYKVTIMAEGQTHTVETTDSSAPPTLRPLLHQLARLARRF